MKFRREVLPKKNEGPEDPSRRVFLKKLGMGAIGILSGVEGLDAIAEVAQRIGLIEKNLTDKELAEYWEQHKKKIQELLPKLREDIAFLESVYKETFIPVLQKIKDDLVFFEDIARIDARLKEGGITMERFIGFSGNQAARSMMVDIFHSLSLYWDPENLQKVARKSYQENSRDVRYLGFGNLEGTTDQEIKKLFEARFDFRWLYGNVLEFEYVDREERVETYRVAADAAGAGISGVFERNDRHQKEKINFYKGLGENLKPPLIFEVMTGILSHELAHKHSWDKGNTLTIQERIEMLVEVTRRLDEEGCLKSDYVERVIPREGKAKKRTLEEIKYSQVIEYWAEIVQAFEEDKEGFAKSYPRDYELIKRWRDLILSRYGT